MRHSPGGSPVSLVLDCDRDAGRVVSAVRWSGTEPSSGRLSASSRTIRSLSERRAERVAARSHTEGHAASVDDRWRGRLIGRTRLVERRHGGRGGGRDKDCGGGVGGDGHGEEEVVAVVAPFGGD